MNHFKPQVITGIAGSHCIVLLYGWDVHIDAQIEAPGYTRLSVMVGGVPRHCINKLPDEFAPEQILQLIRGYARDARF
jgi:hypothetical protein